MGDGGGGAGAGGADMGEFGAFADAFGSDPGVDAMSGASNTGNQGGGGYMGTGGPDPMGGPSAGKGDRDPIAPSLKQAGPTAAEKKAAADKAAADKKAAEDKKKSDERAAQERRNRSLLTGYTSPNIQRRRLIPSLLEGENLLGTESSTQLT